MTSSKENVARTFLGVVGVVLLSSLAVMAGMLAFTTICLGVLSVLAVMIGMLEALAWSPYYIGIRLMWPDWAMDASIMWGFLLHGWLLLLMLYEARSHKKERKKNES